MGLTAKQHAIVEYAEAHPELTQRQIAIAVGITRESVNRLLSRARKRLNANGAEQLECRRPCVMPVVRLPAHI